MKDIRCVCKKCGKTFLWTHEERIAAISAVDTQAAMSDTQGFKVETDRMRKPEVCGGCKKPKISGQGGPKR